MNREAKEPKETILTRLKKIPLVGWLAGFISVAIEFSLYELAMLINSAPAAAARAVPPKIDSIDDLIPFIPAFIFGYVFSYPFWIAAPVLTSIPGKRNSWNYLFSVAVSAVIGMIMLVLLPTSMDRAAEGVLHAANEPGFTGWVLHLIIYSDGGVNGRNLLPSFHCMMSVCVWLGVAFRKEIKIGWRLFVFAGMLTICVSTVLVKQHYFIDAVAGMGLGAGSWALAAALDPGSAIEERLSRREKKTPEGEDGEKNDG